MGKSEINFADDIDEINEGAQVLVDAAKRMEKQSENSDRTAAPGHGQGQEGTDRELTDIGNDDNGQGSRAKSAPELEVVEGKENGVSETRSGRSRRPEKKARDRTSSAGPKLSAEDDPWVTDSIKVQHSKKRRLKELSLRRELNRDSPYQKKDLVAEALDYIFSKYEKR